jgi:hypothetical protein
VLLAAVYVSATLLTVMPAPWRWNARIVGSSGDAMLNLSVIDWVSHHLFQWQSLWRGQFFQPHPLTTAYTDVVLPQAGLYSVLQPVLGVAGAFNTIELVAWLTSLCACHCLFRRWTTSDVVAFIGSVGWTFSTARLAHLDHFQLVTAGALVPVVVLTLLRVLERPTVARGAALGVSLACVTAGASYYGVMMAVASVIIAAVAGGN